MYGQTEKEQQTIKETFERIQRENAKHDAKLNVRPLPGPLRELLRAIKAAGRQIVLADAPPIPWEVLCEGQRRELIALVRREPPQPDAPAFLQTLRERGPWLPNEPDPARTLANWLARDPETGDRARVVLTDLGMSEALALDGLPEAGRMEAATLSDDRDAPLSAPSIDESTSTITLDGKAHKMSKVQFRIARRIIEANGDWIKGDELAFKDGERVDQTIKRFPDAIRIRIESHNPTGYRWKTA